MPKKPNIDLDHQMLLWEHRGRKWLVKLRFARIAASGRVECVGIDLRSFLEPEELALSAQPGAENVAFLSELGKAPTIGTTVGVITAAFLREFPAGRMIQDGARALAHQYYLQERIQDIHEALGGIGPHPQKAKSMRQRQRASKSPSGGPGRPPYYDEEHFRQVAAIYSAAWENGLHPTQAVKDHYQISESAAGKHVRRARRLGFLPPTTRGVAAPFQDQLGAKVDIPSIRKRKRRTTGKGRAKK